MEGISLEPEVTFRVGRVRASLWKKKYSREGANARSSHWVTLGRIRERRPSMTDDMEALDAGDIPQAILALKKAHDYLQKRTNAPLEEDFLSADALIPRIP